MLGINMNKTTNDLFEKVSRLCLIALLQTGCGPSGNHLLHLAFPPEDLYAPTVSNSVALHEQDFTAEYTFRPKYKDTYSVALVSTTGSIPASYDLSGQILIEFFQNGELIDSKAITTFSWGVYAGKDMERYRARGLCSFNIPLQGRSLEEITVKLSVVSPDKEFEKYKDTLHLEIGVSGIP